jgi:tetratricopeptide (TPR) repeat protein
MKRAYLAIAVLIGVLGFTTARTQTVSAQVEGKVTDGTKPLPGVQLTLTSLSSNRVFKLKTDQSGAFSAIGVPYGDYEVEVVDASGEKLFRKKTSLAPSGGGPVALNIDVSEGKSGGSQQPTYTKEQIEAIKKQREQAMNMNALIQQVNTAMTAKNWQDAVAPLQQLIAIEPTNWQFYSSLGNAQLNLGQYQEAAETYQKGIEVLESNTTVDPKNPATDPAKKKVGEAQMLTNEGNALLKLHKNDQAIAAYTKAASLDPNPATAYFNLCATQYNAGNVEGALDACDKAIAVNPSKADAWFIKGSLLIAGSKTDKDGLVTAPPGTAEALNKYLELAPDGAHADDVKQMLAYIGSKVETTYKKKAK